MVRAQLSALPVEDNLLWSKSSAIFAWTSYCRIENLLMLLGHEQQFGTFGRPNMVNSSGRHQNGNQLQRSALAAHSEENLQPIFKPSNGTIPPHRSAQHSRKSSYSKYERRPFCPDWRCILMCNMIILSIITATFFGCYYYVWPEIVAPLVEKSQPISKFNVFKKISCYRPHLCATLHIFANYRVNSDPDLVIN